MRVAMLSWESLHSIPVGGVGVHVTELSAALEREGHEVHVFTRMRHNQPHYELIEGVHYHRCPFDLHPNFVDEVNNMCRSFVDQVFQTENFMGPFDIIHAHDWLAANAMIWIKQGRGRKCLFTMHSTEYGRCGNAFASGQSARIRELERAGGYWADQVIAVSNALRNEATWRRLGKAVGLCKDYGLTALSRRVYIGNVKKNDLPELQQRLRQLFIGKKDRLFLFMLCKSCMENSTVPLAIQEWIVQPPKFELVG